MRRHIREKQRLWEASSSIWPEHCKKMSKMTIVHLGVIVFALCLSTQVVSLNNTDPTAGVNSTSNPNTTTMATDTYSSSANSTSPTGAGVSLHTGIFSSLVPVIMAASLLQCYC